MGWHQVHLHQWAATETKALGQGFDHFRAVMSMASASGLGLLGYFGPLLPACSDVPLSNQEEKGLEKAWMVGAEWGEPGTVTS